MENLNSRLIADLNVSSVDEAVDIMRRLAHTGCMFKVGLQLLYGSTLQGGLHPVFYPDKRLKITPDRFMVDFKTKDIPRTVVAALYAFLRQLGPRFFTIYADGGKDMLKQASQVAVNLDSVTNLAAVTVLTSLDEEGCEAIYRRTPTQAVMHFADSARQANCTAIVCAVSEIQHVRGVFPEAIIITPGISTGTTPSTGQARTGTPAEAIEAGADYIVVGSSILNAPDILTATEDIQQMIKRAARLR